MPADYAWTRGPLRSGLLFLIMLLATVIPVAADQKDAALTEKARCPVCGMYVAMFSDWNAEITFSDGTSEIFDGPKDMFKYYLAVEKYNPSKKVAGVKAVSVKDYYAKTTINALQAFYVIWGDEYGPMGHEPVPFANEPDAKKYLKEHKGRKIIRFKDVTPKLLFSLDNPD